MVSLHHASVAVERLYRSSEVGAAGSVDLADLEPARGDVSIVDTREEGRVELLIVAVSASVTAV